MTPGLRVGVLGGSFDPPHQGHVNITRRALAGFGLDRVWWLISPGNPLKPDPPAALARRLAEARRIMAHPRVEITDIEARLGTRFTADTLVRMSRRYPTVRFVWLMGADNLIAFHRWEQWREIFMRVPIGVLSRPDAQIAAGASRAARVFARSRVPEYEARSLPFRPAPAWTLLTGPMVEVSSTQLRHDGRWSR